MFGTSLPSDQKPKTKKLHAKNDPALFSQISYTQAHEIHYLADLEEKKKQIDFPIFEFENDFNNEGPTNDYDRLADRLYKKILQKGYKQDKKAPSKKKRKSKNPFEYDYEDAFINDQEAFVPIKDQKSSFENFRNERVSVQQFYNSEFYKSQMAEIQEQAKKKNNGLQMKQEELQRMKRQIRDSIAGKHALKHKVIEIPLNQEQNQQREKQGDKNQNIQMGSLSKNITETDKIMLREQQQKGDQRGQEGEKMEQQQQYIQNNTGRILGEQTSDNSPKGKPHQRQVIQDQQGIKKSQQQVSQDKNGENTDRFSKRKLIYKGSKKGKQRQENFGVGQNNQYRVMQAVGSGQGEQKEFKQQK